MRSFAVAILSSALLLVASVGATLGAAPSHEVISDTGEDNDFCGTGQTVEFSARGQISWKDNQGFGHIATIWTNPANGKSVVDSFSGGGKFYFIDDGNGAYTIKTVREGLPASLRVVNGPLLLHDTGLVAIYDHFDANDNFLGEDIVVLAGPHPSIENPNLWCDLATVALGM